MSNLPDKSTHSAQTGSSSGAKNSSNQVWETKNSSCQTVTDACVATDSWDGKEGAKEEELMVQVRNKTPTDITVENVILKDFLNTI